MNEAICFYNEMPTKQIPLAMIPKGQRDINVNSRLPSEAHSGCLKTFNELGKEVLANALSTAILMAF